MSLDPSQSFHYRYRNRRALWGQLQQVVRPGSTLVTEHPGLHEWLCESILRSDHDFQVRLYKGPSSRGPSVTAQNPIVAYLARMKRWLWTMCMIPGLAIRVFDEADVLQWVLRHAPQRPVGLLYRQLSLAQLRAIELAQFAGCNRPIGEPA